MKKIPYILILALMACVGCRSTDTPVSSEEECSVLLTLYAGDTVEKGGASRADSSWDTSYPAEDGYPSEKKLKDIKVYLVTTGNKWRQLMAIYMSEEQGTYSYRIPIDLKADYLTTLPTGEKAFSGKIVVIANYSEPVSGSPFTPAPYDIEMISERGVIPMWGVTTVVNLSLTPGAVVPVSNTIWLLRSVPKVTFTLDDDLKDEFVITAVEPDSDDYQLRANVHPAGCETALSTPALMIEGCFNISAGPTGAATPVYGTGGPEAWLYTAERECGLHAGRPRGFKVTVQRKGGLEPPFQGKVYLCHYGADGHPDFSRYFTRLVRNHDYQYIITLSDLKFLVTFKEWIFGGKVHIELE